MKNGYAGKILWVDLSSAKIYIESSERYQGWIGGRGLAIHLLAQLPELKSEKPEEQPIVVAAGTAVGTGIPLATRTSVSARNLISGGISYSNVGGNFGVEMKRAGFDAVVIRGFSQRPTYLLLKDGRASIESAGELWGLQVSELRDTLDEIYGAGQTSFIGIGRGGENLVPVSCLIVDRAHAAGWGGSGWIFGAKRLKAIVAVGTKPIGVAHPKQLQKKGKELEWRLNSSEAMAGLIRGGTHGMAAAGGYSGLVPTAVKNIRDEYLSPEESASMRESVFKKWEIGRAGCKGCHIQCLHVYSLETDKFGRLKIEGMHANSVRGFGANLGVHDPEAILIMHKLCNEYGLDVDGVSSSLAFALECAEHGEIDSVQPNGVHLGWGDGFSLIKLVEQIGRREGLGAVLGEGVYRASQKLGGETQRFALMTKRVGVNEQGLRSHRAWALGIMTSSRGGGHLGGSPQTENRRISPEIGERLFGNPFAGDPQSYQGKGKLVAWTEGLKAVVDSMGLCYFAYGWYDLSIGSLEELSELLYLITGYEIEAAELHRFGLKCHTLERYLTCSLGGFSRKDDTLPDRFFDTPVSSGPYQGAQLDRKEVEKTLDEYYEALSWNCSTGCPDERTMQIYGLTDYVR